MSSSALSLTCALGGGGCLTVGSRGVDFESERVIGVTNGRLWVISTSDIEGVEELKGSRSLSIRVSLEEDQNNYLL